jgi:hypothetical protein
MTMTTTTNQERDEAMSDAAVNETLPLPSEAEALASLREFALGPITAVFTWSEAAAILELIELLTTSGIIEVAVRNPSVAEYMGHWEGRAEKAEAEVTRLREALGWYETNVANCRKITSEGNDARHALDADGGQRARAALQSPTNQEHGEG